MFEIKPEHCVTTTEKLLWNIVELMRKGQEPVRLAPSMWMAEALEKAAELPPATTSTDSVNKPRRPYTRRGTTTQKKAVIK